jgi:hypothetical protein
MTRRPSMVCAGAGPEMCCPLVMLEDMVVINR